MDEEVAVHVHSKAVGESQTDEAGAKRLDCERFERFVTQVHLVEPTFDKVQVSNMFAKI